MEGFSPAKRQKTEFNLIFTNDIVWKILCYLDAYDAFTIGASLNRGVRARALSKIVAIKFKTSIRPIGITLFCQCFFFFHDKPMRFSVPQSFSFGDSFHCWELAFLHKVRGRIICNYGGGLGIGCDSRQLSLTFEPKNEKEFWCELKLK